MDDFLPLVRRIFRALNGLPYDGQASFAPEARERLFTWARRHRLTGLLQAGLPEGGETLRTAAYGQAQHTSRLVQEAERLSARLAPSIPSLALLKGPALAAQAWPESGLRHFDDLDFICAKRDFPTFVAGLQEAGYAPKNADSRQMYHLWHYGWGATFLHPERFMVEVNHRFFPPHYPWPRLTRADGPDGFALQFLDTADVRAPTPALHLLLSCEHAIWHGWARLAWIADIAGLMARHPDVFPQAMALARNCSFAERALAAGCAVADTVFGPGLGPAGRMYPDVVAHAIARLGSSAHGMNGAELRKFHERFMTRREILTYRFRRTFTPGDGDFQRLALPPSLRMLYWPLRPLRGTLFGA